MSPATIASNEFEANPSSSGPVQIKFSKPCDLMKRREQGAKLCAFNTRRLGTSAGFQIARAAKVEDAGFAFIAHGLRNGFAKELATRDVPPGSGFAPQCLEFEWSVHPVECVQLLYGIVGERSTKK